MRRIWTPWPVFALVMGLVDPAWAFDPTEAVQRMEEARRLYESHRPDEASRLYEQLIAAGYDDPVIWFNLGNARFQSGKLGRAVVAFRRAWRLAPRDPDIRHNLRAAIEHGSAVSPSRRWYERGWETVSAEEASRWGWTAWWIGWAAVAVALGWSSHPVRKVAWRVVLAAGLVAVWCAAAVAHWRALDAECVVVQPDQAARFVPLPGARVFFTLPEGSIVEVMETRGEWVRIRADTREGWIRSDAIERVTG